MNKVENYSTYQTSYYNKDVKKENVGKSNVNKKEKTDKIIQPELSKKAQELLEELKKKYKNMDFMVADYSDDKEAQQYLSRGSKEYSVLIEPKLLEKMANDEQAKEKYMGIIDTAENQFDNIKEELGEAAKNVNHIGFTVNEDGKVTFFADLEKMSEQQRERIDRQRAKRNEEKTEEEKKVEKERGQGMYRKGKTASVQADSLEELVRKIKEFDWGKMKEPDNVISGTKFDFSI